MNVRLAKLAKAGLRTWKHKRTAILLALSLACVLCTNAVGSEADDKAAEITTLLKERNDMLKKVVEEMTQQYNAGRVPLESVIQAERESLKADLELAKGRREARIAVLRNVVKNAEELAKTTEGRVNAGIASQHQALQAKAFVLEARIDLLREEQGQEPFGK